MTAERPNVLLVDDEEVFRLSTVALLQRDGYRCDSAQDAEEASRLLANSYDALISDIQMPGNRQMEFLREVHRRYPNLPILVVTGYPSLETALTALRLSFVDYLLKPIDWPQMLQAVSHAVERGKNLRKVRNGPSGAIGPGPTPMPKEPGSPSSGAAASGDSLRWPLNQYLAQSATQMNLLSDNIKHTLADIAVGTVSAPTDVCEFMRCPRRTAYKQAVVDTIEVLERTKHAFKSKDLGELRRRLEGLLKESHSSLR